jgi:hypothetical protein
MAWNSPTMEIPYTCGPHVAAADWRVLDVSLEELQSWTLISGGLGFPQQSYNPRSSDLVAWAKGTFPVIHQSIADP